MWLVESFADFHAKALEAAQKNIQPGQAPAAAPVSKPPAGPPVLWDFATHPTLIAQFKGVGPVLEIPGMDDVPTWLMVDGDIEYIIPAWPQLNTPTENFLGFAKEPHLLHLYMIQVDDNKVVKVFKK